jgi:hypothetical protein
MMLQLPTRHGHHPNPARHPGKAYYLHKRASGKNHNEAMRCLKRRLCDSVHRQLVNDTNPPT